MPNSQQLQRANAQAQIKQLQGIIREAQLQLAGIQGEIKSAQRRHVRVVASLERDLKIKSQKLERAHAARTATLDAEYVLLRAGLKRLEIQKDSLDIEVNELRGKLQRLNQEYSVGRRVNLEKLEKLQTKLESTEALSAAKQLEHEGIIKQLERDEQQLTAVQGWLVQGEKAYEARSQELRDSIQATQHRLDKIERTIREYEAVMQATREADETRAKDLEAREQALIAGRRALGQERQDFADEKQRFYQTKAL